MVDDEFIMGTDIDREVDEESPVVDEVEVLNSDRLILVRIHTTLIKLCLERYSRTPDVHLQFHALNLLDFLFANLLPVPSLLNTVMKYHHTQVLGLHSAQQPRARMMSHSVNSSGSEMGREARNAQRDGVYYDLEK